MKNLVINIVLWWGGSGTDKGCRGKKRTNTGLTVLVQSPFVTWFPRRLQDFLMLINLKKKELYFSPARRRKSIVARVQWMKEWILLRPDRPSVVHHGPRVSRMFCRRNVQGTVGGRHGLDATHVHQRLRVVHHDGVRAFLAHGLPERGGRLKNGHRTIPGGHTRAVHGQVTILFSL